MGATIINFRQRRRDLRLTAGLEQIGREIDCLLSRPDPAADIGQLLDVTERLSDQLTDIGRLLLDEETQRRFWTGLAELSAKIASARQVLDALEDRASSRM